MSSTTPRNGGILSFLPRYFLLGLGTLTVILLFSFVSKRYYENEGHNPVLLKKASDLLKQSADWTFSAQQAQNPVLAMTHANYGAAYLNMARHLATDKDLEAYTGVPVKDLREDVVREERRARQRLLARCPGGGDRGRVAGYVGYRGTGTGAVSTTPNVPSRPPHQQRGRSSTGAVRGLQAGGFGPVISQGMQ